MNYFTRITSTAERDIIRAVDYIEFVLKNPDAANHLLDTVTKQIDLLSESKNETNFFQLLFYNFNFSLTN